MVCSCKLELYGISPESAIADEFDPDRFIDERLHKYLTPNPYIFLPFNAGPRICLGQQVNSTLFLPYILLMYMPSLQFAYNEISFMIIRLLQTFDSFELDVDAQSPDAFPPPEWKNKQGRRAAECIVPKAHLSLYIFVSRDATVPSLITMS